MTRRVIVIEDDETTRDIINDHLEDMGFDFLSFSSPDKVIVNNLKSDDIFIIDVRMGQNRTGGIDFIINLRDKNSKFNNNKVIFTSNFGRERVEHKLSKIKGEFKWIDKPIEFTFLIKYLKEV